MSTYTVTLPLRTIQLELQDKKQTAREGIALFLYQKLHDELWRLRQHWEKCRRKVKEQQQLLKDCEAAYEAMETETRKYGQIAGYDSIDYDLFPESGEYRLRQVDLTALVETLRELVAKFNKTEKLLDRMYNRGLLLEDRFDDSFSDFDDYHFGPIISDYDNVQVDTFSLDMDFDKFRESCGETTDLFDTFMDEWNGQVPQVKELSEKIARHEVHLKCVYESYKMANPANLDTSNAALN